MKFSPGDRVVVKAPKVYLRPRIARGHQGTVQSVQGHTVIVVLDYLSLGRGLIRVPARDLALVPQQKEPNK